MLKRCECCNGKKQIMGLGLLMKKCPACVGIGFIDEPEPTSFIPDLTDPEQPIKPNSKRKPKIKDDLDGGQTNRLHT